MHNTQNSNIDFGFAHFSFIFCIKHDDRPVWAVLEADAMKICLLYYYLHFQRNRADAAYHAAQQHTLSHRKRRSCRRIAAASIQKLTPSTSVIHGILRRRNNKDFITLFGVDVARFDSLLLDYSPFYKNNTISLTGVIVFRHQNHRGSRGRRRLLSAPKSLAIVLTFMRTECPRHLLSLLHGITSTCFDRNLRLAKKLLKHVLKSRRDAVCAWPQSQQEVDSLAELVQARFPHCPRIWGFVDGMKLRMDKPSDSEVQRLWYSQYKKYHCTSNIFLFCADGLIANYAVGAYGRASDSMVMDSANLYHLIDVTYMAHNAKVAADSTFLYKEWLPSIVKLSETATTLRSCASVIEAEQVTSARQSVEWGMSDPKKGCP